MSDYLSLKKNADFRRLYRRGKTYVTPCAVAYVLPNRIKAHRLGITAGKKVGGAVSRNRAKRRLRAVFREYLSEADLKGRTFDFVIVARAKTVGCDFGKLKWDIYRALNESIKQIKQ